MPLKHFAHDRDNTPLKQAINEYCRDHPILDLFKGGVPLKYQCTTDGGEYHGPCPLCKDGQDRFMVWPKPKKGNPRAYCRVCEVGGDAVFWAMQLEGLDPKKPGATTRFLRSEGYEC